MLLVRRWRGYAALVAVLLGYLLLAPMGSAGAGLRSMARIEAAAGGGATIGPWQLDPDELLPEEVEEELEESEGGTEAGDPGKGPPPVRLSHRWATLLPTRCATVDQAPRACALPPALSTLWMSRARGARGPPVRG